EVRFLALPLIVGRVDMQRAASFEWLRLAARFHANDVRGLAGGAVGIGQLEPALVFGPRLQVENAARESIGNRVIEVLAPPIDVLAANPDQRQRLAPRRFADRPKLYGDGRIAICVAANSPLEAEVQERGVLDDEFPRGRTIFRVSPGG